jgi:hypothetical protein
MCTLGSIAYGPGFMSQLGPVSVNWRLGQTTDLSGQMRTRECGRTTERIWHGPEIFAASHKFGRDCFWQANVLHINDRVLISKLEELGLVGACCHGISCTLLASVKQWTHRQREKWRMHRIAVLLQ